MIASKISPIFKGIVKNGKLILEKRRKFDEYLRNFEGQTLNVTVKKPTKKRSNQQNRYYWGVVLEILSQYTGHDAEYMHFYLRNKFLGFNEFILDEEIRIVPSTTSLTTVEIEEYLSKIRMWSSVDHSCFIPSPREVDY